MQLLHSSRQIHEDVETSSGNKHKENTNHSCVLVSEKTTLRSPTAKPRFPPPSLYKPLPALEPLPDTEPFPLGCLRRANCQKETNDQPADAQTCTNASPRKSEKYSQHEIVVLQDVPAPMRAHHANTSRIYDFNSVFQTFSRSSGRRQKPHASIHHTTNDTLCNRHRTTKRATHHHPSSRPSIIHHSSTDKRNTKNRLFCVHSTHPAILLSNTTLDKEKETENEQGRVTSCPRLCFVARNSIPYTSASCVDKLPCRRSKQGTYTLTQPARRITGDRRPIKGGPLARYSSIETQQQGQSAQRLKSAHDKNTPSVPAHPPRKDIPINTRPFTRPFPKQSSMQSPSGFLDSAASRRNRTKYNSSASREDVSGHRIDQNQTRQRTTPPSLLQHSTPRPHANQMVLPSFVRL